MKISALILLLILLTTPHANPKKNECGQAPEPFEISPYYAPVVGSWPLWSTIGYGGEQGSNTPQTWKWKVLWLVNTSYEGEVKIRGSHVDDDSPVYFSFGGSEPVTEATLNPENPGAYAEGSEQFANFPSYVWASKVGCYVLEAEWQGGLWRQTLMINHVAP